MKVGTSPLAVIVGTTAMLLAAFTAGRATESVSFDASWWRDLEPVQQLAAIEGAMDGFRAGYSQGSHDTAIAYIDHNLDTATKVGVRLNGSHAYWAALLHVDKTDPDPTNPPTPSFPDTFGTYRDGVTHFYENQPWKNDLTLGVVLSCLLNAPPKYLCSE